MNPGRLIIATTCAAVLLQVVPPLIGEAGADVPDQEWFEECLGIYEPDADWMDECEDSLDDWAGCTEWSQCYEDYHDFLQTRTCGSFGAPPCEPGEQPLPVQWYRSDVPYEVNIYGTRDLHPDDDQITEEVKDDVRASFEVWNEQECSDFEMVYDGTTTDEPPPHYDEYNPHESINYITWRDDHWPYETHGAGQDAVALTTVTFRPSSGEILSADIELNTDDHDFTNTDDTDDIQVDLRNTMAHEVGHFLGLDHSSNEEATMWRSADRGETKKRTLHDDDITGLCFIYPEGRIPASPDDDTSPGRSDDRYAGCGCATTFDSSPLPVSILAVALLLAVASRPTAGNRT